MSTVSAALADLVRATRNDSELAERLENAVTIAQMGGVDKTTLEALLHLAAVGSVTPTVERRLKEARIDVEVDARWKP